MSQSILETENALSVREKSLINEKITHYVSIRCGDILPTNSTPWGIVTATETGISSHLLVEAYGEAKRAVKKDLIGDLVLFHLEDCSPVMGKNEMATKLAGKDIQGTAVIVKKHPNVEDRFTECYLTDFDKHYDSQFPTLEQIKESKENILTQCKLDDPEYGEVVAYYQFLCNREAGQIIGCRQVVRKVTQKAFEAFILPKLQQWGTDYVDYDYETYLESDAETYPYYKVFIFGTESTPLQCKLAHTISADICCGGSHCGIRVPSFDCVQARVWGKIKDKDVSRKTALRWQQQIGKELNLPQPPRYQ